jgi:hypothetical protein
MHANCSIATETRKRTEFSVFFHASVANTNCLLTKYFIPNSL